MATYVFNRKTGVTGEVDLRVSGTTIELSDATPTYTTTDDALGALLKGLADHPSWPMKLESQTGEVAPPSIKYSVRYQDGVLYADPSDSSGPVEIPFVSTDALESVESAAQETRDALTAAIGKIRVPITSNAAVMLGDSISAYTGAGATGAGSMGVGILPLAAVQSKQRIQFRGVFGYPGAKTTQIASNWATVHAAAPASATVFLLAGTNDASPGASFNDAAFSAWATTYTNLVKTILESGRPVVVCLLPPLNGSSAEISNVHRINSWLRRLAERTGLRVADFYTPMTTVSGDRVSGAFFDGAHPSVAGNKTLGAKLVTDIAPAFPVAVPVTAQTTDDPWNLLAGQKALMTPDASGWAKYGGTSKALSLVTPGASSSPAGLRGKWLGWGRESSQTSDSLLQIASITTGWSVGDRIAFSGRVVATGLEAAASALHVQCDFTGSSDLTGSILGLNEWSVDIADGTFYAEGVIPAATTGVRISAYHRATGAGGATTVLLGELTIRNITRAALA